MTKCTAPGRHDRFEDGSGRVRGLALGKTRSPRRPARVEGCRRRRGPHFPSRPELVEDDLVGGRYEMLCRLGHGGLGWARPARDRDVDEANSLRPVTPL